MLRRMTQFLLVAVLALLLFGRKFLAKLSDMLLIAIGLVLLAPAAVMTVVALTEADWVNAAILAAISAMAVWILVPAFRSRLRDLRG